MSWDKIYAEVPDAPFGGGKDERELHSAFETFVGRQRAFQLMRIHTAAKQAASGNQFTLRKLPSAQERFYQMAQEQGFTVEECDAYLSL